MEDKTDYMKMEYVQKMMKEREEKMEKGYNEKDFDDEYWTSVNILGQTRLNKDTSLLMMWYQDLFSILNQKGTMVEIGSGAGNLVNNFRLNGFQIEGCEYSASGRKIAKSHFGIDLKPCDLRKKLPYKDNEFDWSLSVGVFSMIPIQHMENAIKECLRISKYGFYLHVNTIITRQINLHHLTSISTLEYWKLMNKLGALDVTTIIPPQRRKYGIGVLTEFSGLFCKKENLKYWLKLPRSKRNDAVGYSSETQKIRDTVLQYCEGSGIDIGCGEGKIKEDALGIDSRGLPGVNLIHNVAVQLPFEDGKFDYVYSSHTLEHMKGDLIPVVKEWTRVLKKGGYFILYLPHKKLYTDYNPEHFHEFDIESCLDLLEKSMDFEVVEQRMDEGEDKYSFLVVVRKK